MHDPKMIVLGLIAGGRKYGLEMEKFIAATNMRMWARIGGSTIYKSLRDVEKEGCVTATAETAKRGPGKTVYELTALGKTRFDDMVGEALASRESIYSDRIAGLVFALSLPRSKARAKIAKAIEGLGVALDSIKKERKARTVRSAQIVLDFYKSVYEAERRALIAVQEDILKAGSTEK